jgi:hypothetical protein
VLEDITNLVVRVDKDGNRTINIKDIEDKGHDHEIYDDVYLYDVFCSSDESEYM